MCPSCCIISGVTGYWYDVFLVLFFNDLVKETSLLLSYYCSILYYTDRSQSPTPTFPFLRGMWISTPRGRRIEDFTNMLKPPALKQGIILQRRRGWLQGLWKKRGYESSPANCKLYWNLSWSLSLSYGNLPWLRITRGREPVLLSKSYKAYCWTHFLGLPVLCLPELPATPQICRIFLDLHASAYAVPFRLQSSFLTLSLWGHRQLQFRSYLSIIDHSTIVYGQPDSCCYVTVYMVRPVNPEKINPLPFFFWCGLNFLVRSNIWEYHDSVMVH